MEGKAWRIRTYASCNQPPQLPDVPQRYWLGHGGSTEGRGQADGAVLKAPLNLCLGHQSLDPCAAIPHRQSAFPG